MTEKNTEDGNPESQETDKTRKARAIRFSDPEWDLIEKEATRRGISASGLVRQAAVGFAAGQLSNTDQENSPVISAVTQAQIDRIYRGVYLLATLKRDEMLVEGRKVELEKIIEDGRKTLKLIQESAIS